MLQRVQCYYDSGDAPGVPVQIEAGTNPSLTWLAPDGLAIAAVVADYHLGKFQFVVYGRDQVSGSDGHVAVQFDDEGRLEAVRVRDFRVPPITTCEGGGA